MKKLALLFTLLLTLVWLVGCSPVLDTQTMGETQGAGDNGPVAEEVYNSTTEKPAEKTESTTQPAATVAPERLTRQEAKQIALNRAGVAEKDVSRYEAELDYDDDARRWEYEIGFYVGTAEYDVEIDAVTGKVLRYETKKKPTSSAKPSSTRTTSSTATQTSGRITREEAKRIALEQFGVAEKDISRYVIELDYDDDARRWEYEIGFYVGTTEYDVELDAKDGKVIRSEKDKEREPVSTTAAKATISKAEAKASALKRAGVAEKDISRYEIELDYDDDTRRWEYEISFNVGRTEYEITVDGTTGKVLKFEKDVD